MTAKLDAALAYAEHGWSIFPIEPATKQPYEGTRGFHDATTDQGLIRRWWEVEPEAWIALALRMSGLIAIDIDCGNGKNGNATFAKLEAKYGPLPRDLVQASNNGGRHILLRDPSPGPDGWTRNADAGGEIRGNANKLGCGNHVDFKCNGYILLEPSGRYRWEAFGDPPPVPDGWLLALRKEAGEMGLAPDGNEGLEVWAEPSDPKPLARADVEKLRADLRALGPRASGKGTTFAAVLRVFHDYGMSLEAGYPVLCEWNAHCGRPYPPAELHRQIRRIAASGRASGARGNRRNDISRLERIARASFDARAVDTSDIDTDATATATETSVVAGELAPEVSAPSAKRMPPPSAPAAEPVHPNTEFGALLETAAQAVLDRTSKTETKAVSELQPMFETARSLLAKAFPKEQFLIESLLTEGGLDVIGGEPKTTKSWVATEYAIAITSHTPVFGKFRVARAGCVAYFYAEDIGPSVQTRINALTAGRTNMAPGWQDRLIVQPRGRSIDLSTDMDLVVLIASVWMHVGKDIDLLILDPLRDLHSGEEDKSDAMKPIMERMRIIGDVLGCAVMFVHHTSKPSADTSKRRGGQRLRGSGAVHGSVDCGLYLFDLRGDTQSQFLNAAESEIKNARSAGVFDLQLDIVDGPHGTAERATWTVSPREREVKDTKPQTTTADILMALLAAPAPLSDRAIHQRVKGSFPQTVAAVQTASREGLITTIKAGTMPLGWGLTDKGRQTIQAGQAPPPPARPHPAIAALCNIPEEHP